MGRAESFQLKGKMELKQAIEQRRSIRDFQPKPVPGELIEKILDAAIKAPSNSNRQPWEFLVVTGRKLEKLITELESAPEGGRAGRELKTWDDRFPMPEDGNRRAGELMKGLLQAAARDGIAPAEFIRANFRFFGAPCVIVVLMDKGYGYGSLLSIGAAIQNLLLAAHDLGLGSCWMMIPLERSQVFRQLFRIPDHKILVSVIALGYAKTSTVNQFKSNRDPKEKVVKFLD
jgi:nitroreductase